MGGQSAQNYITKHMAREKGYDKLGISYWIHSILPTIMGVSLERLINVPEGKSARCSSYIPTTFILSTWMVSTLSSIFSHSAIFSEDHHTSCRLLPLWNTNSLHYSSGFSAIVPRSKKRSARHVEFAFQKDFGHGKLPNIHDLGDVDSEEAPGPPEG